jgi:hypothetical protein
MAFWIGLYPKPFFQILEQPVNHTISMARPDYPLPGATRNTNATEQPAIPLPYVGPTAPNPPAASTSTKVKGTN